MVVIAYWLDFTLLILPFISIFLACLFLIFNVENTLVPLIILILGGLCLCGSIVYSIIANKGNVFNMIVSIFAKIFVLIIIPLSLLYIFRARDKKNSIYDEFKHDVKTIAAIGVVGFMIFSLVSTANHKALVRYSRSL